MWWESGRVHLLCGCRNEYVCLFNSSIDIRSRIRMTEEELEPGKGCTGFGDKVQRKNKFRDFISVASFPIGIDSSIAPTQPLLGHPLESTSGFGNLWHQLSSFFWDPQVRRNRCWSRLCSEPCRYQVQGPLQCVKSSFHFSQHCGMQYFSKAKYLGAGANRRSDAKFVYK